MNYSQKYLYTLSNYQAIKEAIIKIDGITVLAGENGCGKSTISRWIYYLINTINQFDRLFEEDLMSHFYNDLVEFSNVSRREFKTGDVVAEYHVTDSEIGDFIGVYMGILDKFCSDMLLWNDDDSIEESKKQRVFSYLGIQYSNEKETRAKNISDFHRQKTESFDSMLETVRVSQELHSKKDLIELICTRYKESIKDIPFLQLNESGFEILDEETFGYPYNLKKAIYIDTPMALGHKDIKSIAWTSLQQMMINESKKPSEGVERIIFKIKRIINGSFSVEENLFHTKEIHYKRNDGLNINIDKAATGLNAFAYLQLLLQNGYIDNETLLLIDEPEAHLHPQWIVEFARLLVLIHKHIGTKIMIASHNPDMVSAISSIAVKEGIGNDTNFYVAEKTADSWQYTYKELGVDISEIFKSFNIAISRINEYGE